MSRNRCEPGCTCRKHRNKPLAPEEPVGYYGLHDRVYTDRGRATDYPCEHCEGQARHWAWVHDTDGTDTQAHFMGETIHTLDMIRQCYAGVRVLL